MMNPDMRQRKIFPHLLSFPVIIRNNPLCILNPVPQCIKVCVNPSFIVSMVQFACFLVLMHSLSNHFSSAIRHGPVIGIVQRLTIVLNPFFSGFKVCQNPFNQHYTLPPLFRFYVCNANINYIIFFYLYQFIVIFFYFL